MPVGGWVGVRVGGQVGLELANVKNAVVELQDGALVVVSAQTHYTHTIAAAPFTTLGLLAHATAATALSASIRRVTGRDSAGVCANSHLGLRRHGTVSAHCPPDCGGHTAVWFSCGSSL